MRTIANWQTSLDGMGMDSCWESLGIAYDDAMVGKDRNNGRQASTTTSLCSKQSLR
jgi:hypothetical protein